jgi:diphosphomevalonate decarboxylase
MPFTVVANTMQALVKYHGLKDWNLRIPYHDSISVNTSSLYSEVRVSEAGSGREGSLWVDEMRNEDALRRVQLVSKRLTGKSFEELGLRMDSENTPGIEGKGLGFSSSAGAALTFAIDHATRRGSKEADLEELSKVSRLFAASASRTMVGGFSRLHAGKGDEDTYSERFADERDLPLRTVIVPLPSTIRTEMAHEEVESSPFFSARIESAAKRCDEVEKAILGGDLKRLGELVEQDTMELHGVTMTGKNNLIVMSGDTIRVITKVRELRSNNVEAYFSMQTGPSVFINTNEEDEKKVKKAMSTMGYRTLTSSVGREARVKRGKVSP